MAAAPIPPVVLVDANILFSRTLRDYFVFADEHGAAHLRWSRGVLSEMSRNLELSMGFTPDDSFVLVTALNEFLPQANVEVNRFDMEKARESNCDTKDTHVLAAAISAGADLLVSSNLADFPADWMQLHGIKLASPSELLLDLIHGFPDAMLLAHISTVAQSTRTETEILEVLARAAGPEAAAAMRLLAGL